LRRQRRRAQSSVERNLPGGASGDASAPAIPSVANEPQGSILICQLTQLRHWSAAIDSGRSVAGISDPQLLPETAGRLWACGQSATLSAIFPGHMGRAIQHAVGGGRLCEIEYLTDRQVEPFSVRPSVEIPLEQMPWVGLTTAVDPKPKALVSVLATPESLSPRDPEDERGPIQDAPAVW